MALGNLKDLNDYLFAQLDRLDNIDTSDEMELKAETERAYAVCKVSSQIVANANVVLKAVRTKHELLGEDETIPLLVGK